MSNNNRNTKYPHRTKKKSQDHGGRNGRVEDFGLTFSNGPYQSCNYPKNYL